MSELSTISRHAITVLTGQLAVMAFGVTDTIVAGRYGEASLAALSVGSAIFISVVPPRTHSRREEPLRKAWRSPYRIRSYVSIWQS